MYSEIEILYGEIDFGAEVASVWAVFVFLSDLNRLIIWPSLPPITTTMVNTQNTSQPSSHEKLKLYYLISIFFVVIFSPFASFSAMGKLFHDNISADFTTRQSFFRTFMGRCEYK